MNLRSVLSIVIMLFVFWKGNGQTFEFSEHINFSNGFQQFFSGFHNNEAVFINVRNPNRSYNEKRGYMVLNDLTYPYRLTFFNNQTLENREIEGKFSKREVSCFLGARVIEDRIAVFYNLWPNSKGSHELRVKLLDLEGNEVEDIKIANVSKARSNPAFYHNDEGASIILIGNKLYSLNSKFDLIDEFVLQYEDVSNGYFLKDAFYCIGKSYSKQVNIIKYDLKTKKLIERSFESNTRGFVTHGYCIDEKNNRLLMSCMKGRKLNSAEYAKEVIVKSFNLSDLKQESEYRFDLEDEIITEAYNNMWEHGFKGRAGKKEFTRVDLGIVNPRIAEVHCHENEMYIFMYQHSIVAVNVVNNPDAVEFYKHYYNNLIVLKTNLRSNDQFAIERVFWSVDGISNSYQVLPVFKGSELDVFFYTRKLNTMSAKDLKYVTLDSKLNGSAKLQDYKEISSPDMDCLELNLKRRFNDAIYIPVHKDFNIYNGDAGLCKITY